MLLTKEQILAQRLPTERLKVPWLQDAEIIVRAMPGNVIQRCSKLGDDEQEDAFVFVNVVVDENGQRLYSDADAKTITETVDRSLIQLVWAKAWGLSSVPKERQEEIKKNLPPTLATALYGESPPPSDTPTQT